MPSPHPFTDDQVPMDLLRQRAYNLRWATLPPGTIALTAADPDFPAAPAIRERIARYALDGVFSYGPAEGLPEFREACARYRVEKRGLATTPDQILAADSAAAGMRHIAHLLLRPGDEAIVFDPVDFLFKASVEAAGATVRLLPVDPRTGAYDFDRLPDLLSPRTRLIGVCNPHNPVGRVLSAAELETLGAFAVRHDLHILNDEIWSDIVYPGTQFVSLPALSPEIAERCWTVHGFSKTYGLAGLRIGYVECPNAGGRDRLAEDCLSGTTMTGATTLSQIAATAALEEAGEWADAWLAHLHRNRDLAVETLAGLPGVSVRPPEGTYVLFPRVSIGSSTAEDVCRRLLEEHGVAVVPGAARWFGPGAEGHLRIVSSTSEGILREGLARLARGLAEWPPEPGA
ncbi:MAG: pyridoxal phosphate-dependent aminotransferase [Armatimonadota bacterium]